MVPRRPPLLRCALTGLTALAVSALALGYHQAGELAAQHGWERARLGWLALEAWGRQRPLLPAAVIGVATALLMLLAETRRVEGGLTGGVRRANALLGFPLVPALCVGLFFLVPRSVADRARPTAPAGAPNVLFVLVDTWRADHAGFLGYERDVSPTLDKLVEEGVVFERAISSSGWTKPAVASLMTGLMPSRHGAISQPLAHTPVRGAFLQPHLTTLVEIFRAKGWDTAMWSNNPNITPPRGFDQGAAYFRDYYHDRAKTKDFDPGRAERMIPDAEAWLRGRAGSDQPFFAYLHVMDPHYPYVAPPPFKGTFDRSGLDFQLLGPVCRELMTGKLRLEDITPEMRQRILDIYDEELLYVDHHVGEFLQRVLSEHPNTIVVLSGDHGEEFLEHGNYGHAHAIWNELAHVPLVVWGPELEPGRVPWQVRLMDVFPTLLELGGLAAFTPPDTQGESLLPLVEGREAAHRLAPIEVGGDEKPAWHWRAISDGRYKYLRRERNLKTAKPVPPLVPDENAADFPVEYLFDLERDPGEQENLFEVDPARAEALFEEMKRRGWYTTPEELVHRSARSARLSADAAKGLEALGYGGGDGDGHH